VRVFGSGTWLKGGLTDRQTDAIIYGVKTLQEVASHGKGAFRKVGGGAKAGY
jgi:hypothetical protein